MSPSVPPSTPDRRPVNVHGCAILVGGRGILVTGPARSGKSSLCLSTLRRAGCLGIEAKLVADDRVDILSDGAKLRMAAPERLFGLIEVSGVGILREAAVRAADLDLVVELAEPAAIERLPADKARPFHGVALPHVALPCRQAAFGADVLVSLALAPPARDL